MPIRKRNGQWHYRFYVHGREYTGSTDLAATERNETPARRKEAEARRLVLEGRAGELRLQIKPFSDAVREFLTWTRGEYQEHPATARRIGVSFASLGQFFGQRAVLATTAGDVEDYKAWRRLCPDCRSKQPAECQACGGSGKGVREVTIRHDLHALSLFFQYAAKHGWARTNPVEEVEIPSDRDAVRIHVLTPQEEQGYFQAAGAIGGYPGVTRGGAASPGQSGPRKVTILADSRDRFGDLYDFGRLMLLTGCRPEELFELRKDAVMIDTGRLQVVSGKTTAARRALKLTEEARAILGRRLASSGPWVFPRRGQPSQHLASLQKQHEAAIEKCGLSFVLYDLRHTFATRMAAAGCPVAVLAAILGHANLRSVSKYVHLGQAHIEQAIDQYGWALSEFRPAATTEAVQ